jgi:acetyltransferase-like isoleucine patch superfamily enzyme
MEDFASLAPQASVGGNCRIGRYAAVGIGAVISHGIQVGEHTVIGAGSTVLDNIGPLRIAYGTPAKAIRERKRGDKYL